MTTKLCIRCNTRKELSKFGLRYGKHQPYCKQCNREYNRAHYQANKEKYKADALSRKWDIRSRNLQFLQEYAKEGCVECGENDYVVLEFDHIDSDTKSHLISKLSCSGYSIERIKKELDKCQILCANCHRRKTAKQLKWYINLTKNN